MNLGDNTYDTEYSMTIRQRDANRFRKTYSFSRQSPRIVYQAGSEDDLGANFTSGLTV